MPTTSWIWAHDGKTHGAELDVAKRNIYWFDAVGCACGGASMVSSFEDFVKRGSPLSALPDDVYAEMLDAVRVVEDTH